MPRKSPTTYVHVNQHKIRSNKKHDENEPVITVKKGSTNVYTNEVYILDKDGNRVAKVHYGGNDKTLLSCGARVVIETEHEVEIV